VALDSAGELAPDGPVAVAPPFFAPAHALVVLRHADPA
jgi:hypothetical protein